MARSKNQKEKMLTLMEILRLETDESNPYTTAELLEKLADAEIPCERKSLAADLEMIQKYFPVCKLPTKPRRYYWEHDALDIHTIRFLLDATQSAAFLSAGKTKEISAGIAMLAGTRKAEVLVRNVICFDKLKHSNNDVLNSIDVLNSAIANNVDVSFGYYVLGVSGKPVPKRDKNGKEKQYVTSPIALMYNGGYYYLVAYDAKHKDVSVFRIDRMLKVQCTTRKSASNIYSRQFKNGTLKNSMTAFGMWPGKTERVTLRLPEMHAGDILDKFGSDTRLWSDGTGKFTVTVEVNPNDPVFLGWCMSYGNELEVAAPNTLRQTLLERADAICRLYRP